MKRFLLRGKKLVISEKTKAGARIAEILGCTARDGYWESEEYIVAPARGHLLNLWLRGLRVKSISDLPATKEYWRVLKRNREQLDLLRELSGRVDSIIIATDFDREGEVIGWNIYKECVGIDDPAKIPRAYFSALTESQLEKAFSNIVPMDEGLLIQGLARHITDTIMDLNLTKALTILFKDKFEGLTQAMSAGRVQSPLLSFISSGTSIDYDKEEEKKTYTYKSSIYIETPEGDVPVPEELGYELNGVDEISIKNFKEKDRKITQAEKFPNTYDIQSGLPISPDAVLKIAESLYLKGYSTYPRTKERNIPIEMLISVYESLRECGLGRSEFKPGNAIDVHPKGKKQAIVPTPEGVRAFAEKRLIGRDRLFMEYLITKFMRGIAPELKVKEKKAEIEWEGGSTEIDWGEKCSNIEEAISVHKFKSFPEVELGEYSIKRVKRATEEEESPSLYQPVFDVFSDKDLVRWLSVSGLGTEATRHTFSFKLRKRKYIDDENLPTTLGMEVSKILDKMESVSPELTSEMEGRINSLTELAQLDSYKSWVVDITEEALYELEDMKIDIEFKCPKGHEASLKNTRNGLFLLCQECEKFHEL